MPLNIWILFLLKGQRILPFNDLQMGYRHVALKTEANFPMALSMLFVQIDVKIYVPDGFGDFMDALSDPRAFASAQEKRAEQLKSLGIEESEIGTNVIESKKKPGKRNGNENIVKLSLSLFPSLSILQSHFISER